MLKIILNQAFLTIAIFVVAVLGLNILYPCEVIEKIKIFKEEKTRNAIAYTLFVLSGLLCIYFICDIFIFNCIHWGYAVIKLALLSGAIMIFCCIQAECFGEFSFSGGFTLIVYTFIIVLACAFFYPFEDHELKMTQIEAYNEKIIVVEEPKVSTKNYNLICINDVIDVDSSYNITLSDNDAFYVILETKQEDSEDGKKDYEVYSVYYESKDKSNKIEPLTLNKDSTELYFIQKGEVPHIKVTTSTYYALDTNVEPNKECNHRNEVSYELHIPKGSILSAEKKDAKQK